MLPKQNDFTITKAKENIINVNVSLFCYKFDVGARFPKEAVRGEELVNDFQPQA